MTYLKRKLDFQPCYVKIDKKTGQTSHLVKIITVTEKSALWKSLPGNKNLNFWRQTIVGREPGVGTFFANFFFQLGGSDLF